MTGDVVDPDFALEQLDLAGRRWSAALRAHSGFAARLLELADAAEQEAAAFRLTHMAGIGWEPRSGARRMRLSWELRPEAGRPGPREFWRRFDLAVRHLGEALEGIVIPAIVRAFDEISEAARELAEVIERAEIEARRGIG